LIFKILGNWTYSHIIKFISMSSVAPIQPSKSTIFKNYTLTAESLVRIISDLESFGDTHVIVIGVDSTASDENCCNSCTISDQYDYVHTDSYRQSIQSKLVDLLVESSDKRNKIVICCTKKQLPIATPTGVNFNNPFSSSSAPSFVFGFPESRSVRQIGETTPSTAPSFGFYAPRLPNPPSAGAFSFGTGTPPVRSTNGFSFGTGETSSNPPTTGGFSFGTGTPPVRSTSGFSFGTGDVSSNFARSAPPAFSFGTSEPMAYSSGGYCFADSETSNAPQ
jgi:hypothetical protein